MGGLDPEFVSWEQGYNCGHSPDVWELVGRIAYGSKHRGLAHYVSSGSFKPVCPAAATSPAYSDALWTPASAGITAWRPTPEDLYKERLELNRFYAAGGSVAVRRLL